eukprot:CAMPEP_0185159858 /NCGR_PEP_ID=MMETSP1139-20130426/3303_1 /TAXON_ID=298111 /ORGANISM="Pavlova sp., Strain CCMP459" /LENGTH=46 /DNA_ID= /DNA_START= /DNA_END= /DNA_ORIENTATION=
MIEVRRLLEPLQVANHCREAEEGVERVRVVAAQAVLATLEGSPGVR